MGERGLLPLGLPQHGLAQAPLTPLTHADAQECREGANDINGGVARGEATTEGLSSEGWKGDMCSVPKPMGTGWAA